MRFGSNGHIESFAHTNTIWKMETTPNIILQNISLQIKTDYMNLYEQFECTSSRTRQRFYTLLLTLK